MRLTVLTWPSRNPLAPSEVLAVTDKSAAYYRIIDLCPKLPPPGPGHQDGLPLSRRFTSQFNTNVMFQLQSYEANNVLRLQGSAQTNVQGTLTLVTPGPYR